MMQIKKFIFNPFQLNTYLLYDDTGECVIIDAGNYTDQENRELSDFIDQSSLKPVLLLNTHCHIDHILGNRFVYEQYGLKPRYHKEDEYNLLSAPSSARIYGLDIPDSPKAEDYIEESDSLVFGNTEIEVLLTPGHTAGHLSFLIREDKTAIVGDVLFYQGIGRTDLPGGDYKQLIDTIKTKLFILNQDYIVYPGHGPHTSIGEEKLHNPFLV